MISIKLQGDKFIIEQDKIQSPCGWADCTKIDDCYIRIFDIINLKSKYLHCPLREVKDKLWTENETINYLKEQGYLG